MWIQPAPNLSCRKKMSTKIFRVRHLPGRCLIINLQSGMDEDVKTRIGKVKRAFLQLQTIWKSRELPQRTKIRISNSNIKAVLLYLWWRGMENNKSYRHQSTNFHQHLPPGNPEGALAREDQQYQPVRQQIRTWNKKKEIEPDIYGTSTTRQALSWNPRGIEKEKRQAEKNRAPRPPGRHREDGHHLEPTRSKGAGQGDSEGLSSIDSLYPRRGGRLK